MELSERDKKFLRKKIEYLRASKIHYHNAEGRGIIDGKIQEVKDLLAGKPAPYEMTDEELEQAYQKYSKSNLFKLAFSDADSAKREYLRKKIETELKYRREARKKEELKKMEINSSVLSKDDLIRHGIIPSDNTQPPVQKEVSPAEEQRKMELVEYTAAFYHDYYRIISSTGQIRPIGGLRILPAFKGTGFYNKEGEYLCDYQYYIDNSWVYKRFVASQDLSLSEFRLLKNDADAETLLNKDSGNLVCAINMTFEELAQDFITKALAYRDHASSGFTHNFYGKFSNAFYDNTSVEELKEMIKDYFLTIIKLPRNSYGD